MAFPDNLGIPGTHLVRVGCQICQVAVFLRDDLEGDLSTLPLSDKAKDTIQKIIWTTIVSPPTLTNDENPPVLVHHKEFRLKISVLPWELAHKYRIQIDDTPAQTRAEKLRFDLYDPEESGKDSGNDADSVERERSPTTLSATNFDTFS
ncbi:hypothetical protein BGZ83_004139 [Gryganskiella cystojenkinii]|nr:hypothetical protein BGZ83_004139 [Gryganskiella cystojenkinii]